LHHTHSLVPTIHFFYITCSMLNRGVSSFKWDMSMFIRWTWGGGGNKNFPFLCQPIPGVLNMQWVVLMLSLNALVSSGWMDAIKKRASRCFVRNLLLSVYLGRRSIELINWMCPSTFHDCQQWCVQGFQETPLELFSYWEFELNPTHGLGLFSLAKWYFAEITLGIACAGSQPLTLLFCAWHSTQVQTS